MVTAFGNGVLGVRSAEKMAINGGKIILPTKWAHNVLKSLD